MALLTQNKAKLGKNLITILVFEKSANFSPKKSRISQKIMITTSTPVQRGKKKSLKQCYCLSYWWVCLQELFHRRFN
jgi:hypothetical protein